MGDLFYWYFIGVLASIPFAFYDIGMYLANELYSKVGGSKGARIFAFFFYLFICFGSWVAFILDAFAFVCDLIFGIKRFWRNGDE